jgi:quercetin dioxygenase-like cupin family protein
VSFFLLHTPPGEGPGLHRHPYAETFVLQEGQATFTVGDETIEARAGDIVVAPADTPHAFVNSGAGVLRSMNIHPVAKMETVWL